MASGSRPRRSASEHDREPARTESRSPVSRRWWSTLRRRSGRYIRVILKVSHNLHASTLPLLLAARHGERTLDAGLRRQGERAQSTGHSGTRRSPSAAGPAAIVPTWQPRVRPWLSSEPWPRGPSSPPSKRPCRSWAATARWPGRSPPTAPPAGTPAPRPGPIPSRTGSTAPSS